MLPLLVFAALTAAAPVNLDNGGMCLSIRFSPDDSKLAVGCLDKSVHLWDVKTGKRQWAKAIDKTPVLAVAFSDDGKWVAGGDNLGNISVWDVKDGTVVGAFKAPDTVSALAFSPDKKVLAVACFIGCSGLYATADWKLIASITGDPVAWSANGKTLLTSTKEGLVIVDAAGTPVLEMKTPGRAGIVVAARDAKYLLARAGTQTEIQVLDGASGKEVGRLTGHTKGVVRLEVSKDGSKAVSGSEDRTVRLWDVGARRELVKWTNEKGSTWVAISPSGKQVASIDENITHVWPAK